MQSEYRKLNIDAVPLVVFSPNLWEGKLLDVRVYLVNALTLTTIRKIIVQSDTCICI